MRFKDFLSEKSVSRAQQAAIAISKKEKGEEPKNEDAEAKARLALKHTQEKERLAQKHEREKEALSTEEYLDSIDHILDEEFGFAMFEEEIIKERDGVYNIKGVKIVLKKKGDKYHATMDGKDAGTHDSEKKAMQWIAKKMYLSPKAKARYAEGKSVLGDARTILYREKLKRLGYAKEEFELEEESRLNFGDKVKTPQGTVEIKKRDTRGMRGKQDDYEMILTMKDGKKYSMGSHPQPTATAVKNIAKKWDKGVPSYMKHMRVESVELDEGSREADIKKTISIMKKYPANKGKSEKELRKGAIAYLDQKKESVEEKRDAGKSATGYDIYHDTYSAAMQHAYAHAKKKHGVTVRPSEIDDKVASGPRKPSTGKTVSHILKTDKKQNLHVQVYNTGRKYELNMYVESVELDEASIQDIKDVLTTIAKSQNMNQAVQMVMKKYKVDQGKAKAMVKKAIDSGVTYDKIKKKYAKESVELDEANAIDLARDVVKNKGAKKGLDMQTANAILTVYDKVNDANKKKMEKMPVDKLGIAVWKILGKAR